MRNYLLLILCSLSIIACNSEPKGTGENTDAVSSDTARTDNHPAWIMQGNVYEVNLRQYTPEGTIKAFEQHLQRLKDMGVQTLWFMPITPISKTDRKGVLGSYYAVADYKGLNPEYGTMDDWKALVKKIHGMGMKVIIDWVPNHTGADHPWLTSHPDFYVKDSSGKVVVPFGWTDVRELNYDNTQMVDSMIASMKFWIKETGIDGFRCDVAAEVPQSFWTKAIPELKNEKNIFMLAEGDEPWLHQSGFDATYTWNAFNLMKLVAKGERPASALDSAINRVDTGFVPNALRLYFTSNHDENSWNKADYGTMPGEIHAPFAVFTQTAPHSVPLVYSGQEEPFLDSLSFFYKDTITWKNYARAPLYKTLLNLRKNNPALSANASFQKLATSNDKALYAFERRSGNSKVLVVLNLSSQPRQITWTTQPSQAQWKNAFTGAAEQPASSLQPWGYAVYEAR